MLIGSWEGVLQTFGDRNRVSPRRQECAPDRALNPPNAVLGPNYSHCALSDDGGARSAWTPSYFIATLASRDSGGNVWRRQWACLYRSQAGPDRDWSRPGEALLEDFDFHWCHLFVHFLSSSRYTITLSDYQSEPVRPAYGEPYQSSGS